MSRDRPSTASGSRKRKSRRRISRIGEFEFKWFGDFSFHWSDLYLWLLVTPWWNFFGLIVVVYSALNVLFALAYLAGGDGIENAQPGSFWDAFFFSVQTMATIGYGAMYPKTPYAHVLVAIEVLIGLLAVAMATSLMFARFSRPTARVLFSQVAAICPYNGVPTLMFRAGNQRRHTIVEAQIRVHLLRPEVSEEGHQMRRFYELKLARANSPFFLMSWTVMHPIDENSPLYGETAASLNEETRLIVMLTGIDEVGSQTVHASYLYTTSNILWNRRFVDILTDCPNGGQYINYSRFHDTQPLTRENW
ncbi:MAG: ion channel [Cyanobacteriota bacterium]|nr:ion channel [Cyanobacteriota bacterium]